MLKKLILITLLLSLVSYAFVYFSHSYGPHSQYPDSKHYYEMVKNPMDINAAPAPFVYRQFTTCITNLSINISSDSTDRLNDNSIYSHLFLTNLLGIFMTMILLSYFILSELKINDISNIILAPLLLFLSYKVMHQAIGNLCEGWSYFFIALIFLFFKRNQLFLMFFCLVISLFVKETIALISMMYFASSLVVSLIKKEVFLKKTVFAFVSSFFVFLVYFLTRKYWIIVPGFENQISLSSYPVQLMEFMMNIEWSSLMKLFLHQNSLLILMILLIYQKGYKYLIYSNDILAILITICGLYIICASTGIIHNDISRIISSSLPLCIMIFWERIFVK